MPQQFTRFWELTGNTCKIIGFISETSTDIGGIGHGNQSDHCKTLCTKTLLCVISVSFKHKHFTLQSDGIHLKKTRDKGEMERRWLTFIILCQE